MKIASVNVEKFRYRSTTVRDSEGHGHPGPEHDAVLVQLKLMNLTVSSMKAGLDALLAGYYSVAFGIIRHMLESFFNKRHSPALDKGELAGVSFGCR